MKKFRSFTIIELVMSLLISSIVIGIAYYVLLFFNKQYTLNQNKSQVTDEFLLFRQAMEKDFDKAEMISDSLDLFLVFKYQPSHSNIIYRIDTNNIVRQFENVTDSFSVKNNGYKTFHVNDNSNLISQVLFQIKLNNIIFETSFSKQYSAAQLMKEEN